MRRMIDPIRMLREILDDGNQAQMARKIGISPQYLNDVLNGKRGAGDKILAYLGLEKIVTYRKRRSANG
jgi:transcriptional regulator with XRE-family HTH domain